MAFRAPTLAGRALRSAVAPVRIQRRNIETMALVYEAVGASTGSRASGNAATKEGNLELKLGFPKEMGGLKGPEGGDTNPEQLFSLAYSACFLSALAASSKELFPKAKPLGKNTTVRARIGIGKPGDVPGFRLSAQIEVLDGPLKEAGLTDEQIVELVKAAHELCPYSRAVRGNIETVVRTVSQ